MLQLFINKKELQKPQPKDFKSVISRLLDEAEKYKNFKNNDKRILLEIYGLALGLSSYISEQGLLENIEQKILKTIEDFILKDLKVVYSPELENLSSNFNYFKRELTIIREQLGSLEEFLKNIMRYLQGMMGSAPKPYAIVTMGSLGTEMATPYSDIEYFVMVDKLTDYNKIYFENLAFLMDLMMLSFGETPIYKAEYLLKDYKEYYQYCRKGIRVDEHKEPDDNNRLFSLINTPAELIKTLALRNKIIHKPGNHLTAALLTTRFLMGDKNLHDSYMALFERALDSSEYLECLRTLLQEDLRVCETVLGSLRESSVSNLEKTFELKKLLSHSVNLARVLSIFLKSAGETLSLQIKFVDVIAELQRRSFISSDIYQDWHGLVNRLYNLRLELQLQTKSSAAIISLKELQTKFNLDELLSGFNKIIKVVNQYIDAKADATNAIVVDALVNIYLTQDRQFQAPPANEDYIVRPKLWKSIIQHFARIDEPVLVLALYGTGGMGKRQTAQYYFQNPPILYGLRVWFRADNREILYDQYIELGLANGMQFDKDKPIEQKAIQVRVWLEQQKNFLLVYANVKGTGVLDGLLPRQGKHHVLMTSRNGSDWPPSQKLEVSVMDEDEAIALVEKKTGRKDNPEKIKILVGPKYLGGLPLALAQAAAFMAKKQTNASDYLALYDKHKVPVMSDASLLKTPEHEPIWITFDLNFQMIASACPAALYTLKQASWLSGTFIAEEFLRKIVDESSGVAVELLWPNIKEQMHLYSLMSIDVLQGQLSIHPVLQDIIQGRQEVSEKNKILNLLFKNIHNDFWTRGSQNGERKQRSLILHLESLAKHYEQMLIEGGASELADILNDLAFVYYYGFNNIEKAEGLYQRALPMLKLKYGEKSLQVVQALGNIGNLLQRKGDIKEQREYSKRVLQLTEELVVEKLANESDVACALINLSNIEGIFGNIPEKIRLLERVLAFESQNKGDNPPGKRAAACFGNLGGAYGMLYLNRKAIENFEKAFRIFNGNKDFVAAEEVEDFACANCLLNLGEAYKELGELSKAEKYLESANKFFVAKFTPINRFSAMILGIKGCLQGVRGDFQQQKILILQSLDMKLSGKCYPPEHPSVAVSYTYLGNAHRALGEFEDAKRCYETAKTINENHYEKDQSGAVHIENINTMVDLGNLYLDMGELQEARKLLEPAVEPTRKYYGENMLTAALFASLGLLYSKLEGYQEQSKTALLSALQIYVLDKQCHHDEVAKMLIRFDFANENAEKILENASSILEKEWGIGNKQTVILKTALQCYKMQFSNNIKVQQKSTLRSKLF